VDSYSLVYDSARLEQPLSILGRPRACLKVSANASTAHWFVRLSDLAPDGVSTFVSGAGMAGAHRQSMLEPMPLVPNTLNELCIDLHLASWVFPAGHRLRIAVSNSMWPMIWPTPYAMTTTLDIGGANPSRIDLPVVPDANDLPRPTFKAPEIVSKPPAGSSDSDELNLSSNVPGLGWTVRRDPAKQLGIVDWRGGSLDEFPWGSEQVSEHIVYRADDVHPELSSVQGEAVMTVKLKDRELVWRTVQNTHSDQKNFYIEVKRQLTENGKEIRSRQWQTTVPRDGQ